jgi:CO/xanthine dehydrogenase Mo-binding subunit
MDLPRFDKVLLETPFPTRTFGAIGFGEISTSPGPGAVLMAVSNALGRKISQYPATPEVILTTLGEGKGGDKI